MIPTKIHKEGVRILTISFVVFVLILSVLFFSLGLMTLLIGLVFVLPFSLFLLRFFRVPSRVALKNDNKIISPADGTIVAIEEVEETEFLNKKCTQISVFMSVWNVHINWFPIAGKVVYSKYHPGKYLMAWNPKSSTLNERTSVAVEREDGQVILFRQIAGFLARRIICKAVEGTKVDQAQEVGFIKFGSRVDIFVPIDSKVRVSLNEKVVGTQTVLADIPLRE
jgi:phosphatidylserine decarboxylase